MGKQKGFWKFFATRQIAENIVSGLEKNGVKLGQVTNGKVQLYSKEEAIFEIQKSLGFDVEYMKRVGMIE